MNFHRLPASSSISGKDVSNKVEVVICLPTITTTFSKVNTSNSTPLDWMLEGKFPFLCLAGVAGHGYIHPSIYLPLLWFIDKKLLLGKA